MRVPPASHRPWDAHGTPTVDADGVTLGGLGVRRATAATAAVAGACLIVVLPALAGAGSAARSSEKIPPKPQDFGGTWIGSITMNGPIFREGDQMVFTATGRTAECFGRTPCVDRISVWGIGGCTGKAAHVVCKERARRGANVWNKITADFSNPTGTPAVWNAYYYVLPKKAEEALVVSLHSGQKTEASFRLRMTVENRSAQTLSAVTLQPLRISRKSVKLLKGPTPSPPRSLAPRRKAVFEYQFRVLGPGKVRVIAGASARDRKGKRHAEARAVDVDAAQEPDAATRLLAIVGTIEEALEVQQKKMEELNAGLSAIPPAGVARQPPLVAGVGAEANVGPWFDWVPGSAADTLTAAGYLLNGAAVEIPDRVAKRFTEFSVTTGEGLSTAYDFWFKNLGWKAQTTEELMNQSVALTEVLLTEPAASLSKPLRTAKEFYASEGAGTTTVLSGLPRDMAAAGNRSLGAALKEANDALVGFGQQVKANPEGAWTNFGRVASGAGVDLAIATAVTVWGPAAFGKAAKLANAERVAATFGAESLEALAAESTISVTKAARAGGILEQDSAKIQQTLRKLEREHPEVGKLEVQVRPSVPESIPVYNRGGIPKPEILKEKTITRLDLELGADPKGLGQAGLFKPVRPPESFLRALRPDQRGELLERLQDRQAEFAKYSRGDSNLNKALREGGSDFDLGHGRKAHFEATVENRAGGRRLQNNTLLVRNKELVLDRRRIGKVGAPFASDIDVHALIKYGANKNLPAEIRAQLELKLKTELERLGVNTGGHGWTFSGFDFAHAERNAAYRAQLLLLYADPKNAAKNAANWLADLKRRLPNDARIKALTVNDLLHPSGKAKYVLKYTAENIRVGFAPNP